jgi:mannose-6-phosphate isomerase-like protein (cupin superfamily)
MNTIVQNDAPTEGWCISKNILSSDELNGSLTIIGPGGETLEAESASDRVLYVAQGSVTATMALANYILNADETLQIPANRTLTLRNKGSVPAKVFSLTLPAPRRREEILVFPS